MMKLNASTSLACCRPSAILGKAVSSTLFMNKASLAAQAFQCFGNSFWPSRALPSSRSLKANGITCPCLADQSQMSCGARRFVTDSITNKCRARLYPVDASLVLGYCKSAWPSSGAGNVNGADAPPDLSAFCRTGWSATLAAT